MSSIHNQKCTHVRMICKFKCLKYGEGAGDARDAKDNIIFYLLFLPGMMLKFFGFSYTTDVEYVCGVMVLLFFMIVNNT